MEKIEDTEDDPNKNSQKATEEVNDSMQQEILSKSVKIPVESVPPDGGWGWIIILGGLLTIILGAFQISGFSILYSPLLMGSGSSSATIAWIFNTQGLTWNTFPLFIGPLCKEYGFRKIAIFGGIITFFSVFTSTFITEAKFLFFTFSFFGGIGDSIGYIVCSLVVAKYFRKRVGFALAITSSGGNVSAFVCPILANYLLENYGYRGASIIYSAVVLNQCVGAALFQPVEWHMKPCKLEEVSQKDVMNEFKSTTESDHLNQKSVEENSFSQIRKRSIVSSIPIKSSESDRLTTKLWFQFKKIVKLVYADLKTLKYLRVKLIALSFACIALGYINFQMWIPFKITDAGYSLEDAAWCVSISSVTNLVGRILVSFLSDRKWFNVRYGFMFGSLLIGVSMFVFAFTQNKELFMISACSCGLGVGLSLGLATIVMIDIMGVEMLPAVLGVSCLVNGLIGIVVGPLVGFVRDATSSYVHAMCFLGVTTLFGFISMLIIPFAARYDKKKFPI